MGPGERHVTSRSPPDRADGTPVNLFCSGHAFLPDGRLLVAGGHITDGDGLDQACVYDHTTGTWTALPTLRSGRWYPTVTTLADGRALVISGSHADGDTTHVEAVSEIGAVSPNGEGSSWHDTVDFRGLPLTGVVTARAGGLDLTAAGLEHPLPLRALGPGMQLAWDRRRRRRPVTPDERSAFSRLEDDAGAAVTVTGPLVQSHGTWSVAVRAYAVTARERPSHQDH